MLTCHIEAGTRAAVRGRSVPATGNRPHRPKQIRAPCQFRLIPRLAAGLVYIPPPPSSPRPFPPLPSLPRFRAPRIRTERGESVSTPSPCDESPAAYRYVRASVLCFRCCSEVCVRASGRDSAACFARGGRVACGLRARESVASGSARPAPLGRGVRLRRGISLARSPPA